MFTSTGIYDMYTFFPGSRNKLKYTIFVVTFNFCKLSHRVCQFFLTMSSESFTPLIIFLAHEIYLASIILNDPVTRSIYDSQHIERPLDDI